MFNVNDFAAHLKNYTFLKAIDLHPSTTVNILKLEEEKLMLICPVCGADVFVGVVTIEVQVDNVRPAKGRIVGHTTKKAKISAALRCQTCGMTPEI